LVDVGYEIREGTFPHAFQRLQGSKWNEIETRAARAGGVMPPGYFKVNGIPYAIGDQAYSHGVFVLEQAQKRYRKDYYGVLLGAALAMAHKKGGQVQVFASHPPGAIDYLDNLIDAAGGEFQVETEGRRYTFQVNYVSTFDEPLGGYCNAWLDESGKNSINPMLHEASALVVDMGGGSTDFLGMNPGGQVDYGVTDSVPIGINNVLDALTGALRAAYPAELQTADYLRRDALHHAVKHGVFPAGANDLDCQHLVNEATSQLLNRFDAAYKAAGGPIPYRSIVLTGGGSMLLYTRLEPILAHGNIIPAETAEHAHLANVRGGWKLWKFYERLGVFS
jgi:hypothetical protein